MTNSKLTRSLYAIFVLILLTFFRILIGEKLIEYKISISFFGNFFILILLQSDFIIKKIKNDFIKIFYYLFILLSAAFFRINLDNRTFFFNTYFIVLLNNFILYFWLTFIFFKMENKKYQFMGLNLNLLKKHDRTERAMDNIQIKDTGLASLALIANYYEINTNPEN